MINLIALYLLLKIYFGIYELPDNMINNWYAGVAAIEGFDLDYYSE